jgi:TPR repeat protein
MTNIGALLADQVEPPDLIAAWDWYERAADTGDTGELNNLGNLLADRLEPPDVDAARDWLSRLG